MMYLFLPRMRLNNKKIVMAVSWLLVGAALFGLFWFGSRNGASSSASDWASGILNWPYFKAKDAKSPLPREFKLNVPFTPQSPFANWIMPYEEACEETSALMVDYYLKHKTFTPPLADQEILKIVDWEKKMYGDYVHTDVDQTVQLIKQYFGYKKVRIIEKPTAEQIKREVLAGHPVIVPTAARLLGNPYFRRPGPIYHMLVVTGFQVSHFITNDPGTKRGESYRYSDKVLMNAMHDWMGQDSLMEKGRKVVIVIDG
ncbi:C39 family peptidase [Candidatus Uhrbacteria bacterium]|nr:C39 family peptidase [Candidatus Uhrbacteria bacterium]